MKTIQNNIESSMKNIKNLIKNIPFVDSRLQILRRKYLSRGRGYPNWQNILPINEWGNILKNAKAGKKVLIATSIGSHLAAMQMETSLAVALTLRGAKVDALLCDGILPGCQICEPRFFPNVKRFVNYGPQKDLCGHCYEPGKKVYDAIGITMLTYSQFLSPTDKNKIRDIVDATRWKDIELFEYDGLMLGEHTKAGALRFFAKATIDDEPHREYVLKRYFEAALITTFALSSLFSKEKYDVAVFHHGIYVPQGIIGEVARKYGVRVVNWNPAYRKDCFIFSHYDTYHHTLMDEPISIWEDMVWTEEKEKNITDYLFSRWIGDNDWIKFHENPTFKKEKIISDIGYDPNKPLIGLLTNVMWDAQLHYPANAFANMLEWLIFTVKWFKERTDLQLIIRIHPAEVRGSVPSRQPVIDELKKYFSKFPSNIFIVAPESNLSTYVISELCDSVIIYGTKTGVELTSMGIPVIVAGEAWIRNKGMTMDATSIESYEMILSQLPLGKRLDATIIQKAKKYAYHFFFRRMIPVRFFAKGPGWPPYIFAQKTIDSLKSGEDRGLDCICDGILYEKPFVFDY